MLKSRGRCFLICLTIIVLVYVVLSFWIFFGELAALQVWPFWFADFLLGGRNCNANRDQKYPGGICTWLVSPTDSFLQRFGMKVTYSCPLWERWGGSGDGGYNVCVDEEVDAPRPTKGPCVVYSFGSNFMWRFDLAALQMGCEVFVFDPTIRVRPANESAVEVAAACVGDKRCGQLPDARIHFYELGISGADVYLDGVGPTKTLSTIMKDLGHEHVDLLKVDVEAAEWAWLYTLSKDSSSHVGQLIIEVHLAPPLFHQNMKSLPIDLRPKKYSKDDAYNFYVAELQGLGSKHGFKVAHMNQNVGSSVELIGPWPVVRCYELTLVRVKAKASTK